MSPQRQRLLAVAILLAGVALGWFVVVLPVVDAFTAQSEDIAQSRQLIADYQRRIALRPTIEARLAQMKQREAATTGLIGGTSAELAAANIQNIVKTLVESEAGQVRSAQNLAPVTADGFQRVDIQYDVSLPMTRLKAVAYRIETSVPYLFLDDVDMHAPESWQGAGIAADVPNLEVRWTVHGYRWVGAQ